ncbi:MAG TPA: glycosyltransferase family 39 protein [Anaerolineales bacterium]|nr:glycosyltransferase family 39 protein [Anaerolineales bacterium]
MVPKVDSQTDKLIVLLLVVLTVLVLVVTAPQIGLTWDEPTYMVAAETYPHWYGELIRRPAYALSTEGVTRYWTASHEHPPLSKVWSGFVWLVARHFLDDLTAHRLGNILIVSVLVAMLYLLVAQDYGRIAGLIAALALLTMPRFFFHAHLAAIDVPVTSMIFAVIYVFWLGHDRPEPRWTILLGLMWGIALATKINALFIPPIVLFVWTLIFEPRRYLFIRLVMMGLIGIGVFIISWPWLYHDLFNRLTDFAGFMTTERLPVEQYYFGKMYAPPPWHFPFVMTIIVVPVSLILLAAVGAFSTLRRREDRPLSGLFLLATFASVVIFTSGAGQVFDDERFMMPAFPYVAALAGIGFVRSVQAMEPFLSNRRIQLQRPLLIAIMVVVTFVPHLLLAYDLYPHLLSYYSEVIGGAYGASVLRLETTYWCDTYSEVLSYLNTHTKPGDVVWAECLDVLIYYQLHGQLRPDLQIALGPDAQSAFPDFRLNPSTFKEADYVVIQSRQSGFYTALRAWMQTRKPIYEFKYRSLRLIGVYAQ